MWPVVFLAVALAADAAAVSAGLGASGRSWRGVAGVAAVFGGCQAGMSALGAVGGAWMASTFGDWDHWVAFVLLVGVGGRMAWPEEADDDGSVHRGVGVMEVLALGIATSIDALAAGVSLPLMALPLGTSVAVIGGVTVALSFAAGAVGRRLGTTLGPTAERAAGAVLMLLGVQVLVEHLMG